MKFTTVQWVAWFGATVTAAVMLCAFAFTTFETKADSGIKRTELQSRLERIDDKLDRLLERRPR